MEIQRESWASKLGVILAVAGSAVGLGNFCFFKVFREKPGKITGPLEVESEIDRIDK